MLGWDQDLIKSDILINPQVGISSTQTDNPSGTSIHLLNIANVIPIIGGLGIHFIFIHVVTYIGGRRKQKRKTQDINKIKKKKIKMTWINSTGNKLILNL